jgi:hypothetical protein
VDEAQIIEEMRVAVTAEKLAGEPAGWSAGNGNCLILVLPVEIVPAEDASSYTLATLRIAWRAVRGNADRDVSASLIVTIQGRDYAAWRMDWRPVHPHLNQCGPKELRGLSVDTTGIHEFEHNSKLGLLQMQTKNLPVCVPVDPEPHDFDAFVRFVCSRLNVIITDGKILSPPWSTSFF